MQCIVQLGRRAGCTALGNRRGQAGLTLIEIVISVALVSMVVLGLATGFLTLVRTNGATYRQQQVDHAATNYAESLKAVQYQPCVPAGADPDYGNAANSQLWSPPDNVSVQVVDVEFWDEGDQRYGGSCDGDSGAQRVTILANWGDPPTDLAPGSCASPAVHRCAQIVVRNR